SSLIDPKMKLRFKYSIEEMFQYGSKKSRQKHYLILERGHQCEQCLNTHWFDKVITLELDHIDGDPINNVKENLKLLCPNCHSYTPTWRGRNVNKRDKVSNKKLKEALRVQPTISHALKSLNITSNGANYKR